MQFGQLKRREFITVLGGAAAVWPLSARAQEGERVRHVGVLMGTADTDADQNRMVAVFTRALSELGWKEGPTSILTIAGLPATQLVYRPMRRSSRVSA